VLMRIDREDELSPEYHKILPEYPQVSPSSLKLIDTDKPEIVSREQMQGAIRDYAATQIDLYVQQSVRKIRELNEERFEDELYVMGDKAREWFDQFRGEHEFFKNGKEGEQYSARDVQEYWESRNLTNFTNDIVVAHEKSMSELRRANQMGEPVIFPMLVETEPSLDVYSMQSFIHNAYIPNHIKFQLRLQRNYLIHDVSADHIIIINTRFGSNKDEDTLDVFLQTLFAREDVEHAQSGSVQTRPISAAATKVDNVLYYDRTFDRHRKQFRYQTTSVPNVHNLHTWSLFEAKLKAYKDQYYELRKAMRARNRAFVMPQYNPDMIQVVEKEATNQRRLFILH